METRQREYQKLKNTLVDWNSFEEGMELQDMRNVIYKNGVQQAKNGLLSKTSQSDKTFATQKWSPLWLRDKTNRLKSKDKTQTKTNTAVISASKSSTWQRKDYGRLQNKPDKLNSIQNGRTLNSTMKKVSNQIAACPEATLSPAEEIQDDVLNVAFHNSPPSQINNNNKQTKNVRILNSTLKKSSQQADDGSHVTNNKSNSSTGYSTFWSPLWQRSDGKRLERKPYKTDFSLESFYNKRKQARTLRNGDSISVGNEKIILTDDSANANEHETEEINLTNDITNNNDNNKNRPNLDSVNCSPPSQSEKRSKNVRILNSTLKISSQQADYGTANANGHETEETNLTNDITNNNEPNLGSVNCSPPSQNDKQSKNVRILNATLKKSSKQADDGSHVTTSNSSTGYSTFWSPLWQRSEDKRLERKPCKTDFSLESFYNKRKHARTLRNGNSNISVENEKIISTDDTANSNKSSKSSQTNLNLHITKNNENGDSNLPLHNNNNDKEENVDRSQFSNSSADLTENQRKSSINMSKVNVRKQSYAKVNSNLSLNNNNDNDENVDRSQFSNNSVDLTENQRKSSIDLSKVNVRKQSYAKVNSNLSLNNNNDNDESVDRLQFSNNSVDLTENHHSSPINLSKVNVRKQSKVNSSLPLNNNNDKDDHSQLSKSCADLTENHHSSPINLRSLKKREQSNANVNCNLSLNYNNENVGHSQFPNTQQNSANILSKVNDENVDFSQFPNSSSNNLTEINDNRNDHSNNTSRTDIFDSDRSQSISETSTISDDGDITEVSSSNSFIDDDFNCLDTTVAGRPYIFDDEFVDHYISILHEVDVDDEFANHYLSTLHEVDDENIDD